MTEPTTLPSADFIRGHLHAVGAHEHGCACHDVAAYVPLLLDELDRRSAERQVDRSELTRVENEITEALVKTNLTIGEIAARRYVSTNTVKTHIKNIYFKLGVTTRRELTDLMDGAR